MHGKHLGSMELPDLLNDISVASIAPQIMTIQADPSILGDTQALE